MFLIIWIIVGWSITSILVNGTILDSVRNYLIGKDWTTVMNEVWTKPEGDEYYFKKSHAIAYAHAILVQMNLICEQISYEYG